MDISPQLIEKYNTNGPRYTSYPTALEFEQSYMANDFIKGLQLSGKQPISLYIHIPFCKNICYYCACNKVISKDSDKADKYIKYLLKEAQMVANYVVNKKVAQIHFGGGTPTFLSGKKIDAILQAIDSLFEIDKTAEISIEIDPRTIVCDELDLLKKSGFNRISIGVQDFNEKVQQAVNRTHDFNLVANLYNQAKQSKFDSINIDLIYGLPHQTLDSFQQTIEQVLSLKPDRISLYNYAHLPHRFKPQRRINLQDLPSAEQKIAIFEMSMNRLKAAGYRYIGMDHFALADDPLYLAQLKGQLQRNFQGYTTHKDHQLIGLGVSSISKLESCYSQNYNTLDDYYQSIDEGHLAVWRGCQLTDDDQLRRSIIMSLICNFILDIKAVEEEFAIKFDKYFAKEIKRLETFSADGLLIIEPLSIRVEDEGRYFIRNICMIFDYYLQELTQLQPYSKVI